MLGPDGKYHEGRPITPDDRGGLAVRIIVQKAERRIGMLFGTRLDWLASPPSQARGMAGMLRKMVKDNFGSMEYNRDELKRHMSITANPKTGMVETRLSQLVEGLFANPEVFLAMADFMETAADDLDRLRPH